MNIAEPFIRRPIATTLIMLALLIFGGIAYRSLPVSDLPNVDYPTIQVRAGLPGASPETMASSVATPLEKQFATIAGLDNMSSSSSQGGTSITLQFDLSRNIDAAAQDVQSAIAAAERQLPHNMPSPPSYSKVNPADSPIMYLAVTSPSLPLSTVDRYAETTMAQRFSMVSGVAQVQVYGAQKYAVRVQLDPRKLASRGIGIDTVSNALNNGNVNMPTGTLWGAHKSYTVQATGQLENAQAFRSLIVTYQNGAPVRLDQLGSVLDSVDNDKQRGWWNGQRSVVLAIRRQPGTNTIEVVDGIRELMPVLRKEIPNAIQLHVLFDRSQSIRSSVNDVKFTLLLTMFLVILVIFLFLRNVSATIIPSLALPMSIVGTFALMYLMGYSLDNLSLLALTLSVGFVVDDAIVMLENIVRHMEMGKGVMEAALDGAREIGFTILSMTLSLTAIFIPFLFMAGILGRLLHEFAVTIAGAILVSGFVSLTLTPMLTSRFLKPPSEQKHGRFYNATERMLDGLYRAYDRSLRFTLRHKPAAMGLAALILIATVWMAKAIPMGFLPSEDDSQIMGQTLAQQGIGFDAMVAHQKQAMAVLAKDPNVEQFMSFTGGDNTGMLFMHLKPLGERKLSVDQVINELRPRLAQIPGLLVFMINPPPINIGGRMSRSEYQVTLQSPNTAELYHYATILEQDLHKYPDTLIDVTSDLQMKNPQVMVEINRDRASALGVTAQQIEDALYSAYGNRQVSMIYAPDDEYDVIEELEPQFQGDPGTLGMLYIHSSSGKLVPLSAVVNFRQNLGPLSVNHTGQLPSVTISFNLPPNVSLGDAIAKVQQIASNALPSTVTLSFQGAAQAFQQSMQGLGMLLLMALAVIYIVLGVLYESFIHPLTILSGLPAAGFGALGTLMLFHVDLNIYSFVGIILLVGIVKKNAIMMIDFAIEAERKEDKSAEEAIYQGSLVRFRPIMMTTMAALMGTLPIAMGVGTGADSRRPLGLAVVGGLLFSQFITLYLTPVFYVYMDRLQVWLGRKGPHVSSALPELEAAHRS